MRFLMRNGMNAALRGFYVTTVKKYIPKGVFLAYNNIKERLHSFRILFVLK